MKIKLFEVWPIKHPEIVYEVWAPNKRIARWSGFNMFLDNYCCTAGPKEFKVRRKD